jgi:hypothetical protein
MTTIIALSYSYIYEGFHLMNTEIFDDKIKAQLWLVDEIKNNFLSDRDGYPSCGDVFKENWNKEDVEKVLMSNQDHEKEKIIQRMVSHNLELMLNRDLEMKAFCDILCFEVFAGMNMFKYNLKTKKINEI